MRFNFQLLQIEDTKQHLLDDWKRGMIEVESQGVGSQVVEAISFTKKESDIIITQLKFQGKKFYEKKFVNIKSIEEKLISDWESAQAWDNLNKV